MLIRIAPFMLISLVVSLSSGNAAVLVIPIPRILNANAAIDGDTSDDSVRTATNESGIWVTAWRSTSDINGSGTDGDILFARSTDHGETWSPPTVMVTEAFGDSTDDSDLELAYGGAVWMAVWKSEASGPANGIRIARSTDNALTWQTVADLNSRGERDQWPTIETDGQGNWCVAWQSQETIDGAGGDWDIVYVHSSDNGDNWTAPALLNSDAATDSLTEHYVDILAAANGKWLAVWLTTNPLASCDTGNDADLVFAESSDQGATWSDLTVLHPDYVCHDNGSTDTWPQLAFAGGKWSVIWTSDAVWHGGDWDLLYSTSVNGIDWTDPTLIFDDAGSDMIDFNGEVATDGYWNIIASWTRENGGASDVYYSESCDAGASWRPPTRLNSADDLFTGNDSRPMIATDRKGRWVAVWESTMNIYGANTDNDILISPFGHYRCGDINMDGQIDIFDILAVLDAFAGLNSCCMSAP